MFVFRDDKTLVEMQPGDFISEQEFQELLAEFPPLLSGEQINAETPRRWLLVKREMSIAGDDGLGARWSLDHLFLDQDGIPTLVEVKRQSDTRIRREVVGQMLDYAANSVVYWSVEEIKSSLLGRFQGMAEEADTAVINLIGPGVEVEVFWQNVKTNLQAGKIRLLFVADVIPPELRKIVEFLNRQMDPAEVLALELRQFVGQGMRTIVPAVYGQTAEAQRKKLAVGGQRWDDASIYQALDRSTDAEIVEVARQIERWMRANADEVWYGKGVKTGSISTTFVSGGQKLYPFQFWSDGDFAINFMWCIKPPFDQVSLREEWLHRLNAVRRMNLREDAVNRRPSFKLALLKKPDELAKLLSAMDWFVSRLDRQRA